MAAPLYCTIKSPRRCERTASPGRSKGSMKQLIPAQRASWAGGPALGWKVRRLRMKGGVQLTLTSQGASAHVGRAAALGRHRAPSSVCAPGQRVPNAYAYSGAGSCGGSRSRKRRSLAVRPGSRETDSLLEGRALVAGEPRLALQQFSKLKCPFHNRLTLRSTAGLKSLKHSLLRPGGRARIRPTAQPRRYGW
jgi:hypothetical protein